MSRFMKRSHLLVLPGLFVLLFLIVGGRLLVRAETAVTPTTDTLKSIFGNVRTNNDLPVAHALVVAHRFDRFQQAETVTDADGNYELALAPGLWAVTVEPISGTMPADWVYPHEPQHVSFHHHEGPEMHELNFVVLRADAEVSGTITLPDGSPPPFTVTVSLRNGEGIGREVDTVPGDGRFALALPHGRYDLNIHPHSDSYLGPVLDAVHLPPGATLDLGEIALIARDATISGTVRDGSGTGVAGIPVTAWQRDDPGAITTMTGPDGIYALAVTSGTWHIQPAPGPDIPYLYPGEGETVTVASGETVSNVDFEVLAADATIAGVLVDAHDTPVADVEGWATAVHTTNPAIHNGAPVRNGRFAIHLPAGSYLVSVYLPPGSPYLSTGEYPATVAAGETVTLTIPLTEKDATIAGALVDPRQDRRPVTGVPGTVAAWSGHEWAATHIRPDSGTYSLDVAAGIWHLNYEIDQDEYVKIGGPQNIPVQSGQTVNVPLPVTRKDATIAGHVYAPDGAPLPGAVVIANGLTGDIDGLRLHTRTDEDGRYRIAVPHGRYRVGAAGGEPGWINPVEPIVGVEPHTVAEVDLQFHEPNALISGTLTVLNTEAEGEVLVWAWSERGGFTKGRFPVTQTDANEATGAYELGVLAGTTWHVGAIFETDDAFWVGRESVEVIGDMTPLNLELTGPHPKPPPTVVVFDASQPQRITLGDGTAIFIPAGAMPVAGMVTLRIIPIATLPHQRHARIIKYGYAFHATDAAGRPIEEQFNRDVLIRFAYDERDVNGRLHRIKPAYFSTTTNQWTFPEHFVINRERRVVIMAIDHFTDFALVENVNGTAVYLPFVQR